MLTDHRNFPSSFLRVRVFFISPEKGRFCPTAEAVFFCGTKNNKKILAIRNIPVWRFVFSV